MLLVYRQLHPATTHHHVREEAMEFLPILGMSHRSLSLQTRPCQIYQRMNSQTFLTQWISNLQVVTSPEERLKSAWAPTAPEVLPWTSQAGKRVPSYKAKEPSRTAPTSNHETTRLSYHLSNRILSTSQAAKATAWIPHQIRIQAPATTPPPQRNNPSVLLQAVPRPAIHHTNAPMI